MRNWLIAAVLVLIAGGTGAAQMTKYTVTTEADKDTNFALLTTYTWEPGWMAYYDLPHEQIVAAVDRELAARGFTKVTEGPSDVTITYALVTRTDMDEKAKRTKGLEEWPTYPVSTLHVIMRDPTTHKDLFRGRASTRVNRDPEAQLAIINEQIAEIFQHYPHSEDD